MSCQTYLMRTSEFNFKGTYGFGQSMVWYPTEEEAKPFLKRLIESIDGYHDENWLYKFPGD